MKVYSLLAILLLGLFSCGNSGTPEPNNTLGLSIDNSKFFTITFNGRTMTTYGYKSTTTAGQGYAKGVLTASVNTVTSNGQVITGLLINATSAGTTLGLPNGNIQAALQGQKVGSNNIGQYIHPDGAGPAGQIFDKTSGVVAYDIDYLGYSVNITEVANGLVKGNFNCILTLGSSRIPATGSFCVNLQQ